MKKHKDKQKTIDLEKENPILDLFSMAIPQSDYKEILNDLMDSSENLELKSRVNNPFILTYFRYYSVMLNMSGLEQPSNSIEMIIKFFLEYMISYKGLGRTEVFNAISYQIQTTIQNTLQDRIKNNIKKL